MPVRSKLRWLQPGALPVGLAGLVLPSRSTSFQFSNWRPTAMGLAAAGDGSTKAAARARANAAAKARAQAAARAARGRSLREAGVIGAYGKPGRESMDLLLKDGLDGAY